MTLEVRLSGSAIRDLDRIPPRVVPAIVEFIFGPLAGNPQRVGKPLLEELAGHWSARRSDYRVLYVIDEAAAVVVIIRIGHRSDVHKPR